MLNVLDEGRRRRRATRVAMMSIFICGGGFGVWSITNSPVEYDYGGILCSEVRRLAPKFIKDALDNQTTAKIEAHLRACPSCGPAMQNRSSDRHAAFHNNPIRTLIAVNNSQAH